MSPSDFRFRVSNLWIQSTSRLSPQRSHVQCCLQDLNYAGTSIVDDLRATKQVSPGFVRLHAGGTDLVVVVQVVVVPLNYLHVPCYFR